MQLFEKGEFHLQHHDLAHYKKTYPDRFDSYFKFSFVRNPWDRMYSQYWYQKHTVKADSAQGKFHDWLRKCEEAYNDPTGCVFGRNRHAFIRHITNQVDWLTIDDEIGVDFIGKYESLASDFDRMCVSRQWAIHLPHSNKSLGDKTHYSTFYDDDGRDFVARMHSADLLTFKYQFEFI